MKNKSLSQKIPETTGQWKIVESFKQSAWDDLFHTVNNINFVRIEEPNTFPLETYSIGPSSVTISPDRWATLPSLILDGVEIFYNDSEKRNNLQTSIREWFWMWPQAWPFRLEQKEQYGFWLKQHGFLRDSARTKKANTKNEISYQFASNEETLQQFPFPCLITQTVHLEKEKASVMLNVKNTGKETMPFAPGHHTYYEVDPEKKEQITFSDNIHLTPELISQWVSGEKTLHLPNPWSFQMHVPWKGIYQVDFDPNFWEVRFRSEKDAWFVCVEPVVCHPSNRENSAIHIAPNASIDIWFSITLVSKDI